MIRFGWMVLTALGFMAAGALVTHGEFRVGIAAMVLTWFWMGFPKVTLWLMEAAAKLFRRDTPVLPSRAGVGQNSGSRS